MVSPDEPRADVGIPAGRRESAGDCRAERRIS